MKRWLSIVTIALLGLFAVLCVRALSVASKQVSVPPASPVAIDSAKAAERFAGALRIKTISFSADTPPDRDAFLAMHAYLQQQFPLVHKQLQRETVNDYSLLYTWPGRDPQRKAIILMSHLDVVPVEPGTESKWTYPPFEGRIADGFIWGRGALDVKMGVLGTLEAVEYLVGQGFQPEATVYLAFGHDEELGGPHGAVEIAKLLEARGVKANLVLDEGGSLIVNVLPGMTVPTACIGIAEKGFAAVEVSARAPGGHSSAPPKHTAIGLVSGAVVNLENNQMPAALEGPVRSFIEHVGPEMSFPYRLLFANMWLFQPLIRTAMESDPAGNASLRTTTAATIISGGIKENVLPASARAVINFRLLPGDTSEDVVNHARQVTNNPQIDVRALPGGREASSESPIDGPGFDVLQRSIRAVYPSAVVAPYLTIGGTDSRHYAKVSPNIYRFMPILGLPADLARLHGTNERMPVADYEKAVQFFVYLLKQV